MRSKKEKQRPPNALKPTFMEFILRIFSWKRCMVLSVSVITLLIVFNFYGLYTNRFYFFKFDNYIFPLLTIVHFAFLYVLRFKIREQEYTDPQMRNLEYSLYIIFLVYLYKVGETLFILSSYGDYENHVMPSTFVPIGIAILTLQLFLLGLTLLSFKHRKREVGEYKFDDMNQHIDSWE